MPTAFTCNISFLSCDFSVMDANKGTVSVWQVNHVKADLHNQKRSKAGSIPDE